MDRVVRNEGTGNRYIPQYYTPTVVLRRCILLEDTRHKLTDVYSNDSIYVASAIASRGIILREFRVCAHARLFSLRVPYGLQDSGNLLGNKAVCSYEPSVDDTVAVAVKAEFHSCHAVEVSL